jgi:hypothetical protein
MRIVYDLNWKTLWILIPKWFLVLAIIVVLGGVTGFNAWRDEQRDYRLTALEYSFDSHIYNSTKKFVPIEQDIDQLIRMHKEELILRREQLQVQKSIDAQLKKLLILQKKSRIWTNH